MAPGGRAALAPWLLDPSLGRAVAAWSGRPTTRALAGARSGAVVEPDVVATMRSARRRAGLVSDLRRRPRRRRRARLLVLWDVSGSMAEFVPHFFPWIYGVAATRPHLRVWAFGRDYEDITDELRRPAEEARRHLGRLAGVFGGGTAIAATMAAARSAGLIAPSTVVVVISDGWEAERPEALAGELAAWAGSVRRLVWINPLMSIPGYQPVQRGIVIARRYADRMAAGMPYGDLARVGEQDA